MSDELYDEEELFQASPAQAFVATAHMHDLVHIYDEREERDEETGDTLFIQLTFRDLWLIHCGITMNQLANPCLDSATNDLLAKIYFAIRTQKGEDWDDRAVEMLNWGQENSPDGGEG